MQAAPSATAIERRPVGGFPAYHGPYGSVRQTTVIGRVESEILCGAVSQLSLMLTGLFLGPLRSNHVRFWRSVARTRCTEWWAFQGLRTRIYAVWCWCSDGRHGSRFCEKAQVCCGKRTRKGWKNGCKGHPGLLPKPQGFH